MIQNKKGTTLVSVIVSFAILMIVILLFSRSVTLSLNLSQKADKILQETTEAVNTYYTGTNAQATPLSLIHIFAGVNGNGTNTAVIRNCTYQGESLKGGKGSIHGNGISTTSEDLARVGGITGQNLLGGEIRQCTIGGGSSITGSLSYLGGLAGYNQGLIQDCIEQTESVVVQGIKSSCVGGAVGYNGDEGRTANVSVGIADSTQESKNWSIVNLSLIHI